MSATEGPTGCGRLYGVGVGPGDPELLTLKACRVLRQVPVIFAPRSERSREGYALGIVRELLDPEKQEVIGVAFPTDDVEGAAQAWRIAADSIAARLQQGQDVAFITEGDPMLYSTFSYVLDSIVSGYPHITVEIIPGVSSVMAAAARATVPLASDAQRLAILPAVYGIDDLSDATASYDTTVLMKVNRNLLRRLSNLEDLGVAGQGTYVTRATTSRERVIRDLSQISEEDLDYFSLLIIKR